MSSSNTGTDSAGTDGVVIGVDSSTQSCKVIAVDPATGAVRSSGMAAHPDGTAINPHLWTAALRTAWAAARIDGADILAAGAAAQQHGMVALDRVNEPVFDALLWNDTRSAADAAAMRGDLGDEGWVDAVNVVPVASFTITKLAWLARVQPAAADRVARVVLPHDWLNFALSGRFSTDRSDASGTGYYSAVGNGYREDLLQRYFGRKVELPPVLGPSDCAGTLLAEWGAGSAVLSPGAGDNAAAALGLGLREGEVAVSVGTSGTVFAASPLPTRDPSGAVAGFADATGRHLPLLATLNAARVMTATAAILGVGLTEFNQLAASGAPDAGGLTLLPYLDGERTPNLPDARGTLAGLSRANMNPQNLARSSVLGVLNSLADALGMLRGLGVRVDKVVLIGGGAKSPALRQAAAAVFGVPVEIPAAREYVALGAARQAAWTAFGEYPQWGRRTETEYAPDAASTGWGVEVRGRYVEARRTIYGA